MTGVSVTVRTRSRVREVSAEVAAKLEAGLHEIRQHVAQQAQDNAPVGDPATDPHSGELRDGIGVDGDKIVSTAPHSKFVEFGTVFMGAEPFMAPAVAWGKDAVRGLLAEIRRGL